MLFRPEIITFQIHELLVARQRVKTLRPLLVWPVAFLSRYAVQNLQTNSKDALEQFALPRAREERISLLKMLFTTRQILQSNSKDALVSESNSPDELTIRVEAVSG
ncbi:hypothetical protein Mal48_26520 [Thalassoglobus polymorphus]|uniref:Uncharacterized protein n=1 Tax=Thalassoglobus polymorphus TaxID=2527994 RepID=A0A517QP43_9PLAN|nr:hypothetical protein Mal48_26520 [Thalassoglobus polymorphus]